MDIENNIVEYIKSQRWCSFKQKDVKSLTLSCAEIDDIRLFLGCATLEDKSNKYFFMPLTSSFVENASFVEIDNIKMYDAAQLDSYWKSFFSAVNNSGGIVFDDGSQILYMPVSSQNVVCDNACANSKSLGVDQSNTTLKVGDNAIAFKQNRMLDLQDFYGPELEVNEKLMGEGATFMPQTYGAFALRTPDNKVCTLGLVQEFVENQGDLWSYANNYMIKSLHEARLDGVDLVDVSRHKSFVNVFVELGVISKNMSEALQNDNGDNDFMPELINPLYINGYVKKLTVLAYQAKKNIEQNINKFSPEMQEISKEMLSNWDKDVSLYIKNNSLEINERDNYLSRVHGDFHLGQVLVAKKGLKVVDFDGEPALPVKERRSKYSKYRDVAGMYRSINGYLGPVVCREYSKDDDGLICPHKLKWAQKAIDPLIKSCSHAFASSFDKNVLEAPMMKLEILRKNLYELMYEANNREDMVFVPLSGLAKLLKSDNYIAGEKSFSKHRD